MGFKGFMRSARAAGRRAALAQERQSRAFSRASEKIAGFKARLDTEVEKEIERVGKWEEKIGESPLKALKLSYARGAGWETKPFSDQTGIIKYTLEVKPTTIDDAMFDPASVDLGNGVQLTPMAVAFTRNFTAVALWAAVGGDAAKTLKLVNKASPDASRIALADADGETYLPTDSSLDGRIFGGTGKMGVVTFEAFDRGVPYFDLLIAEGKGEETPIRIRVTAGGDFRADMEEALAQPGVLEQFVEGLRKTQAETHAKVTPAPQSQSRSSCLILLGVLAAGAAVALFNWLTFTARH